MHITPEIIFAGLIGAVLWNMFTWLRGLPSSSSHALFGGLIGAAVVGIGFYSVNFSTVFSKVVVPAVAAPLIAGTSAWICTRLAYALTTRREAETREKLHHSRAGFRIGQVFTSSLVALSHGTNDAQKTMGIITLVLIADGQQAVGTGPQWWVIVTCAAAIALGTYAGGWRIIRTIGTGLTEVRPAQGFSSEASTAAAILASSHLGFALSTTQVTSGSVIGSGLGRRGTSIRWRTAARIAVGWILTLPAAAGVGGLAAFATRLGPAGVALTAVGGLAGMAWMYRLNRRQRVGHHNVIEVQEAVDAVSFPPRRRRSPKRAAKR